MHHNLILGSIYKVHRHDIGINPWIDLYNQTCVKMGCKFNVWLYFKMWIRRSQCQPSLTSVCVCWLMRDALWQRHAERKIWREDGSVREGTAAPVSLTGGLESSCASALLLCSDTAARHHRLWACLKKKKIYARFRFSLHAFPGPKHTINIQKITY